MFATKCSVPFAFIGDEWKNGKSRPDKQFSVHVNDIFINILIYSKSQFNIFDF